MRKIISIILIILTLSTIVACSPKKPTTRPPLFTTTEAVSGEIPESPVEDFQYIKSGNGKNIYITKYIGDDKTVVIPKQIEGLPVTSIRGEYSNEHNTTVGAFENSLIKAIYFPADVMHIGQDAFRNCQLLNSVNFAPNSNLDKIANDAFRDCPLIEVIDLSGTKCQSIGSNAFYGCLRLMTVKFSSMTTSIGNECFYNCDLLDRVELPVKLQSLGEYAFKDCDSLKYIAINSALDMTESSVPRFDNNPSLEQIVFKNGREELCAENFFYITSTVQVIIPQSVKKFSTEAFSVHNTMQIMFLGDTPEIVGSAEFSEAPKIYYNSSTLGWDNCVWRTMYELAAFQ